MPPVDRDEARREVAARGLTPAAVTHLTRDALGNRRLRRARRRSRSCSSDSSPTDRGPSRTTTRSPTSSGSEAVGGTTISTTTSRWSSVGATERSGSTSSRDASGRDVRGSRHSRGNAEPADDPVRHSSDPRRSEPLVRIRRRAPTIHASRACSPSSTTSPTCSSDPTFVAIGLHRPDRWEALLDDVLRAVTDGFAAPTTTAQRVDAARRRFRHRRPARPPRSGQRPRQRARARVEGARARSERTRPPISNESSRRRPPRAVPSVRSPRASLGDADPDTAAAVWSRLLDDESRSVRRATVDAMVDAERTVTAAPARARTRRHRRVDTLEGPARTRRSGRRAEPRRRSSPLADDPDFRVRLEAAPRPRAERPQLIFDRPSTSPLRSTVTGPSSLTAITVALRSS